MRPGGGRLLSELDEEEILAVILPLLSAGERDGERDGALASPGGAEGGAGAVVVGPGDDAAVVTAPDPLIVTTDSMIRGRDWRDDWSGPRDVAGKLGAQNISDIAAMGGAASGALLTITADPHTPLEWVREFAAALGEWCVRAGVCVVGGDLSSAPAEVLHLSLTMWGSLQGRAPVLRSGARAGDVLAVCGSLGWSDAGLASYLAGDPPVVLGPHSPIADRVREAWRWYHRSPAPPWEAGPVAADAGATSMIDLSDGLVRDAGRVARASAVSVELDRERLQADFVADFEAGGIAADQAWRHVLSGGEEHSLLATFPDEASVPHTPETPWRVIGRVGRGEGVTLDGALLGVMGWDHFRV